MPGIHGKTAGHDCIHARRRGESLRMLRATSSLLFATVLLSAQQRLLDPDDLPRRQAAAVVLASGVDSVRTTPAEAGRERLLASLRTARECLPEGSAARTRVDELLHRDAAPLALAHAAHSLVDDLTFTPVAQAELPVGVPGFRALDEIELRHYPTYRLVRTDMKGGTMGAFWPLFQHITAKQIAMTTPVQIDYRFDGERSHEASMAFLYGSRELGAVGKDGKVEVVDMPPVTVLTIGSRGYDRPSRVAELLARLEAWLDDHPEWQVAGPVRTMGYNSPSVPGERRYFEVQIPVRIAPPRAAPKARESV